VHAGQAKRGGQKTRRFGREIEARRIGRAHDRRELQERLHAKAKFIDHHVESAFVPPMAPRRAFDIKGRRLKGFGDRSYLGGLDEQKDGGRIDEAPDQPGASDAIDLRAFARDPDGAALLVSHWHLRGVDERQIGPLPRLESAFESVGRYAVMAQPSRDAVAELLAAPANDDDGSFTEFLRPLPNVDMGAPDRARHQPWIGREIVVGPDVDQGRTFRRADQPRQLFDGDGVYRRHGASSPSSGTRFFGMSPRGEIAFPMTG